MENNFVKEFTIATVSTAHTPFISARSGILNFNGDTPTKRDKRFTFAISTAWGSFVFVGSQHQIRITFEEKEF